MPNFSSNIKVLQTIMDKISTKIFRDFIELENLQSSLKTSFNFAQKTVERVGGDWEYNLSKSRSDFGILINGRDDFNKKRECEYNFLVSPICGFDNLYRSIPYFCTSVAIEKVNEDGEREIIAGLLENTITKETFIVENGQGAYVAGRRMRVSKRNILDNSVVALNFPTKKEDAFKILKEIKNVKINNCSALDLAYIASGKYDAGIIFNPNEYELAVSLFLIKESGGFVERVADKNLILVSANDLLAKHLREVIR